MQSKRACFGFKYKDNKQKDKSGKAVWKEMTLTAEEFMERFLMHVLPKRYHQIRNFGFLTNSKKHKNIKKIREIFQTENMLTDTDRTDDENAGYKCPVCKQGTMQTFLVVKSAHQIIKFDIEAFILREFTDTS
ncbi:transposase [Desulfonema limicola]|nr:transposase [Desulfonema limicola]